MEKTLVISHCRLKRAMPLGNSLVYGMYACRFTSALQRHDNTLCQIACLWHSHRIKTCIVVIW